MDSVEAQPIRADSKSPTVAGAPGSSPATPGRVRGLLAKVHPALFAAGYVLLSFANLPTPASGLWRPLAVAMVAALLLSLLLGAMMRNRALGVLIATGTVLALSAVWLLVAVAASAVLWIGLVAVLRRTKKTAPLRWPGMQAANRMVGVFGAMFAVVAVVSAAPAVLHSIQFRIPDAAAVVTADEHPNVFVILLDGYPSSDVLSTYLDFDNSDFEASLAEAGFDVAPESRSNYTATWATLASMFHGAFLDEIGSLTPFPSDQAEQYARLMQAINEGVILGDLHGRGYRIVTVPSPFEAASLVSADEMRPGGQLTSFELSLLQHSRLLGPVVALAPDFLLDQQRLRIEGALATTADVASETHDDPVFMLTHVLSPHPPIVFEADGQLAELPDCYPRRCTLWQMEEASQWAGFTGQVEHLNQLVTETVRGIVAADPGAVVVIMSDHGSRPPGAPEEVLLENLTAVRSPGHPDVLTSDTHPVDLLTTIFDAYFGTESPRHTYRGWINRPEHPLEMVEVSPPQ